MSMADNIRNGISKKKQAFDSEKELRDVLNSALSKGVMKFMQRMDAGEIPIDNIADLHRVVGLYKEMNGIADVMDGQGMSGTLPEINMRQDQVLDEKIRDGKIGTDEEGRVSVMDMTAEEVADLIRDFDIAQNKENEGTF